MRLSQTYIKTRRTVAKQGSINAYILEKSGYISQVAAGVYAYLPLAVRSLAKIEQIVREQMNRIGASEALFSSLQPQSTWETSARWQDKNFRQIVYTDPDVGMTFGATHEEPMAIVVKEGVQSYRDLPVLLYQFQTKFRKELRPKSGLLRGREFRMKDLYSFHADEESHNQFYEEAAAAYLKIFERLGLAAYRVKAGGGVFSQEFSDEFQILCDTGEDDILVNHQTKTGYNREVDRKIPAAEKKKLELVKAIEVGNIFHLGSKYSDAFKMRYLDAGGERQRVVMGSYGIGISRVLGTLAELYSDEDGLKLPSQIAPFAVVVIDLTNSNTGVKIHDELESSGLEVMLDDRDEPAGIKLVDADLIGYPIRLVYSAKTAQDGRVEIKQRASGKVTLVNREDALRRVRTLLT